MYHRRAGEVQYHPHEGEAGHETYGDPDYWKRGAGANVWGGISVDEENGMIFFGTGQPKSDFTGPSTKGNTYGNSVVALNARTGERKWHYKSSTMTSGTLTSLARPCSRSYHQGRKSPRSYPDHQNGRYIYL